MATEPEDARSELPATDTVGEVGDAYWTWRLFRDGYSARQIAEIRGRDGSSLVDDLVIAAASGYDVRPSWIESPDGSRRIEQAVIGAAIGR